MSYLVERLAELKRHLDHLRELRPRVRTPSDLQIDLSLHNDVLFSLLMLAQLVIDIAGDLGARHGVRFEDYTEAVRSLARVPGFTPELTEQLALLPGFRNVLIHEYVALDFARVIDALDALEPIAQFARAVADYLTRIDS